MEPLLDLGQALGLQVVVTPPAARFLPYEPGVAQHPQVLGAGGPAQREPAGEVARRARTVPQEDQQLATHRVGECGEDVVGGGHGGHITSENPDMSTSSDTSGPTLATTSHATPRRSRFRDMTF